MQSIARKAHIITAGEYNTADMVAEFDDLIDPVADDVMAKTQCLTHHEQYRRGRLTYNISPDLQGRPRAEAKCCLASADSTSEPAIKPTRDEANKAAPVLWPGPLVVPRPPGEE